MAKIIIDKQCHLYHSDRYGNTIRDQIVKHDVKYVDVRFVGELDHLLVNLAKNEFEDNRTMRMFAKNRLNGVTSWKEFDFQVLDAEGWLRDFDPNIPPDEEGGFGCPHMIEAVDWLREHGWL